MIQARAKVFWSGSSQAIRLPKAFRLEAEEVTVRKVGTALILEPLFKRSWPVGYTERLENLPEDFVRPEPLPGSAPRESALEGL